MNRVRYRSLLLFTVLSLFTEVVQPLYAQQNSTGFREKEIVERFARAEYHFLRKEFDEALRLYRSLPESACSEKTHAELCIRSHILRANIARNLGEEELFQEHIAEAARMINAHNLHQQSLQILLLIQKSVFERENARPADARKILFRAQEIAASAEPEPDPVTMARLEMEAGLMLDTEGEYGKAISSYNNALYLINEMEQNTEITNIRAQAHINLGISYRRLGDIDKAIVHYHINRDLVEEVFGETHLEMAYALNGIGAVYYSRGDYVTAGDHFKQAASIFENSFGALSSRRAAALNNAGICYFAVNNIEEALRLFEEAQSIKLHTLGENHPETAVGYANMSRIHMQNGDHKMALEYSDRSIQIRKSVYGAGHPDVISPLIQHGDFLVQMNDYEGGRSRYAEASAITRSAFGENHPHLWEILVRQGHSYSEEQKYFMAASRYLQAARRITGNPHYLSLSQPEFSTASHPLILLEALKSLGNVHLSIYQKLGEAEYLRQAGRYLSHAAETADFLQYTYRSEASKLNLMDRNYDIYGSAFEVTRLLYEETGDAQWLDELFTLSETSRSRIALELLQESQAKEFAGVPASILKQETEYNQKISELYQQMAILRESGEEQASPLTRQFRDSLFYYNSRLHKFSTLLEEQYPVYHELKYRRTLIDRKEAQQLLGGDQTLVKYIAGSSSIIALILTRESIRMHNLTIPGNLADQIEQFRRHVMEDDKENYIRKGHDLYQTLIQPVESYITTDAVIFIPDQALHYLPFEMLLTDDAGQPTNELAYHQLPYLLNRYRIAYAPSVTVMDYMIRSRPSSARNLLAFAPFHTMDSEVTVPDNQLARDNLLAPLPMSQYETQEISSHFLRKRGLADYLFPETATIYINEEANRENLNRSDLDQYSFIHFATHAFINEKEPDLSGIVLRGDSPIRDMLYVSDIYNLNLNADLVVLGACDTGLGTLHRGEGIIGFTRAFIFAGASNLVVSMWPVNDQAAAFLMADFYKQFRNGKEYPDALREAKLNLISRPDFARPRDWAAFVLFGN